jgi:site-specific recombinase XerD
VPWSATYWRRTRPRWPLGQVGDPNPPVEPGLSTVEGAELTAAKRRIREPEVELAVHRRAAELLQGTVTDRLERFHQERGQQWGCGRGGAVAPVRATGRLWRDRAIVGVLLSTGLRRDELVRLECDQVQPNTPDGLRRARITRVRGNARIERTVFLSDDARLALADYLERERAGYATDASTALFLSTRSLSARAAEGRSHRGRST